MSTKVTPTRIHLHKASRCLELTFNNGSEYRLEAELLRVYSPSAEVKGHGPGQEVLQTGKANVAIEQIEMAGRYAVKLFFSDGHDTGIYNWDYLFDLGSKQPQRWQQYLARLDAASAQRDENVSVLSWSPTPK